MKQLLQSVSNSNAMVVDVPAPRASHGEILVRVGASLVSAGTERMVVEFAEKNILQKAMARPDLVRQVINKAGREGMEPGNPGHIHLSAGLDPKPPAGTAPAASPEPQCRRQILFFAG